MRVSVARLLISALFAGVLSPGTGFSEMIPVKMLQADFRIMRHALEEGHAGLDPAVLLRSPRTS